MRVRTWHFELVVACVVLATVALAAGGSWIELAGAGAVMLTFAYMQVTDRLAEHEADSMMLLEEEQIADTKRVHCHAWAGRYLVAKESLWLVYFVAKGAWSAIAGVALFLAYPLWRRWWRS